MFQKKLIRASVNLSHIEKSYNLTLTRQQTIITKIAEELDQKHAHNTTDTIENYLFLSDLGTSVSGLIYKVRNKFTFATKAMKIIEVQDRKVFDEIVYRLQKLSYFTDYKQIVSVCQFDCRKNVKEKKKTSKKNINILMELCQFSLKMEIQMRREANPSKPKYFTQQELLNILIPFLILLLDFEKQKIFHENLRSSKILKGFDGLYKLSGTECSAPFQNQLIDFQMAQARNVSKEQHTDIERSRRLNREYQKQQVYFSSEKSEHWAEFLKLPKRQKGKADVFSLGIIMIEAGNLLQEFSRLNFDVKQQEKEVDLLKERYAPICNIISSMITQQYKKRPNFKQLLSRLKEQGFLNQKLLIFNESQLHYKFHFIDQKTVNSLQSKLKTQDKEIERLKCKLSELQKSKQKPKQKLIKCEEYWFNQDQIEALLRFLNDTKEQKDKFIKLRIDLSYFEDDQKQLCLIGYHLKNHVQLKELEINMEMYQNLSKQVESQPSSLFRNIQTLKNLLVIRMNFAGADFTDQQLWQLGKQLQFMYQVKEIFFNFSETLVGVVEEENEVDKGLCQLYEGVTEMAQLRKFHLTMDYTDITDVGFNHIAKSLTNKKELVELVLSFKSTYIKRNDGLKLIGLTLSNNKFLKMVSLNFNKTRVNQKGISFLFHNLSMEYLTCLKLNFGKTNIKDDPSLESLSSSIGTMRQLKQFSLELCETKVADNFLQSLIDPLGKLTELQELSLGFGKTELKDNQSVKNLATTLEKLTKLKKLSVVLYKTKLGDDGIIALCKALHSFPNLEFLLLSFGKTKLSSDDALQELALSLNNFNKLKHFELYAQKTPITGEAFINLIQSLKSSELESLCLCFEDMHAIKESQELTEEELEEIKTIYESLCSLKEYLDQNESLHTLKLYLSGDIGISIQGVRLVVQGIRNNANIKSIHCYFPEKFEDEEMKSLKEEINEIKKQRANIL